MVDVSSGRVLIDNWLLELASVILWQGLEYRPLPETGYQSLLIRQISQRNRLKWAEVSRNDRVVALLHLLDLIVVSDELIFDVEMEWTWNRFNTLQPIEPILSGIKLGDETKSELDVELGSFFDDSHDGIPSIVRKGALYYLGLGRFLGISYWPSPRRADFLKSSHFPALGGVLALEVQNSLNDILSESVNELVSPFESMMPALDFPGFGSVILANCINAESILPTAMEFRNTKECQAFRQWLQQMDEAASIGNIMTIAKGMADLREVLAFIRREIGFQDNTNIEFQIGISPSLTFGADTLRALRSKISRRRYHITFLRRHLERALGAANVRVEIMRLFPEIPDL